MSAHLEGQEKFFDAVADLSLEDQADWLGEFFVAMIRKGNPAMFLYVDLHEYLIETIEQIELEKQGLCSGPEQPPQSVQELHDAATHCPHCGLKYGLAMGTGDCICEVGPDVGW